MEECAPEALIMPLLLTVALEVVRRDGLRGDADLVRKEIVQILFLSKNL